MMLGYYDVLLIVLALSVLMDCVAQDHSFDHLIDSKDFQGPDGAMLQELKHSMRENALRSKCNLNGTATTKPLVAFDAHHVHSMTGRMPGIVSGPRRRATAWLSKAALTLPAGDFVETGVYIGTSSSIMMNTLMSFDTCDRKMWAFDSFEGLPAPQKEDHGQGKSGEFNVTEATFIENLKKLGDYDATRLIITKGWFKDTCPKSEVKQIAFLRLDGDIFASTWDSISALYDRVVPGGYIYVDDYAGFIGCKKAIDAFRTQQRIFEPMNYVHEGPKNARFYSFEAVWWIKRMA